MRHDTKKERIAMYLKGTPIPVDGPCIHRRYDSLFQHYYCNLTYQQLPDEPCTCEYEDIRTVSYVI